MYSFSENFFGDISFYIGFSKFLAMWVSWLVSIWVTGVLIESLFDYVTVFFCFCFKYSQFYIMTVIAEAWNFKFHSNSLIYLFPRINYIYTYISNNRTWCEQKTLRCNFDMRSMEDYRNRYHIITLARLKF